MIVSCGEALIDFVPARTTTGEGCYVPRAGGSPFNVAVTVGRLAHPAGFLGSVSSDFFGSQLLAALHKSKVDTRYVSRLERPSTLAFVSLASVEPEYTFYNSAAADRYWEPTTDITRDVSILHFGSLSLIEEPAADRFAELMAREKGRRILSLDPNIRPTVVRNKEAAYRARLSAMLGLADVIKISGADLEWLDPLHAPAEIAAAWIAGGASIVVITAGADGSTAFARDGRTIRRPAVPITLVDTVGAGDSFMGSFLVGLDAAGAAEPADLARLDDAAIERALGFAAQVSAITCSRAGADPPWSDEVTLPAGASGAKGKP
ncbi:MAG: carbohydrate kinase [Candidatus Velthaea sp.]|jgi:fructokinase